METGLMNLALITDDFVNIQSQDYFDEDAE